MAWDTGLDGTALEIAKCTHNPLRVMAGPGTGKSYAMKRRVARLIEEGVDPSRILAVTFTRNAANSLLEDLHGLGLDGCDKIHCGTLHGFCFRLLGQEAVFAFTGRKPRPLVTFSGYGCLRFEAEPMIQDICGEGAFGGKRECAKRILAFEAAWARLQSDEPGWPLDVKDQAFHTSLTEWLTFHQAMLIGELVPEALRYLRANPGCAALTAYDHVVVDEYQDLNKAEQELLDLLSENGQLAIVGDVDQSIYSFRHANPEGIEQFADGHPGTHDESLDECRRCPKLIVRLAAHLIKHNHPPGVPPRLNPRPANVDGDVHIVQWASLNQEASGLAQFVRSLVDGGHAPKDILILSPRRMIGYAIRDAIDATGVNVHSFYHEESLEEEKAQEAFTLMTLAANPDDRVSLRWWLGAGDKKWRASQYAVLRKHCEATGEAPRAALERLAVGTLVLAKTGDLVKRYNELKTRLGALDGKSLEEVVNHLFPPAEEWSLGLYEAAILAAPKAKDLKDLKERVTVAVTQPEVPEDGDFVRVMSLHKSKGLTSKTVIVAGCTEGLIPLIDEDEPPARQAEQLREQRRLFYVAITRGTERLVLSSVSYLDPKDAYKIRAKIKPGGGTVASRFMHELGPDQPAAVKGTVWAAAAYA